MLKIKSSRVRSLCVSIFVVVDLDLGQYVSVNRSYCPDLGRTLPLGLRFFSPYILLKKRIIKDTTAVVTMSVQNVAFRLFCIFITISASWTCDW